MNARSNHTLALVGPSFFSYIEAICSELVTRGFPCKFYDERHSNSLSAKIAYRLQMGSLLRSQRDQHLASIAASIVEEKTTDVILIAVEVVNEDFVRFLRDHGIRVHFYMWDSARNKGSFLRLLPMTEGRSSFEPQDCREFGLRYIPLFAEDLFSARLANSLGRQDLIVFLGTLHSHRASVLRRLEEEVEGSGLEIERLLFYHSRLLYLLKSVAHPGALRYLSSLQTRGFTKKEIANAYFKSRAVLDIHHPGQAGLTSRTFESLRAGTRLGTLNRTVESLPAPLHERVVLLDDARQLRSRLPGLRQELAPLSPEMDYFLSLSRFADELLAMAGLPARAEPALT